MAFRPGHLQYFVTVVDEGQITRAARRLHIAQPALSQAIAQLEATVGVRLLERHPRGVSLTPAGSQFYVKAKLAVAAGQDAMETAESLARAQASTVEFGFLGAPPGLDSPYALGQFAHSHPSVEIRYRELQFPTAPTSAWIAGVDIAVCHRPPSDRDVWMELFRLEPRVLLAPRSHRLAAACELQVADALDETFIGLHPDIEQEWAGFWSLDDHRGAPPNRVTDDRASTPQEVLASLSVRDAITAVPASVASVIAGVLPSVVAIALVDASPSAIMLVGHTRRSNHAVDALRTFARQVGELAPAENAR